MAYMYAGKILRVDLSTGEITTVPTERYTKDYLGGKGVSIRILYEEVGPKVDPMSPDNLLCLDTGPFTGTSMPGSGRCHVTSRSPATGLLGLSSFGGYFAPELKWAGYDHLIVKGRAPRPVYIAIQDGDVSIRDASHIWGKDTYETPVLLRKDLGDYDIKWACIGPAGENLVRYASILSGTGNGAGRTGMGCVMGSKNLKAVAVRGTGSVKVANPEKYYELSEWALDIVKGAEGYEGFSHMGDRRLLDNVQKSGLVLVNNASTTGDTFYTDDSSQEKFWKENGYQRAGCFNCPMRCMEAYRVPGVGDTVLSCELTLDVISQIGLKDMMTVYKLGTKMQRYGMDSHALGNMMGWATDLYKRGLITDKQTGGLNLEWGDSDTYLALADKIARRDGLGDILADTPEDASKRLAGDNWKELFHYVVQTKGLPHFNVNSKNVRGTALAHAVAPRGDFARTTAVPELGPNEMTPELGYSEEEFRDQLRYSTKLSRRIAGTPKGAFSMEYDGKAEVIAYYADTAGITDLTLTCKWLSEWQDMSLSPDVQARLLSAGLGREVCADELFEYQRRVANLERAYDCRVGLTRADDTVPDRFFDEPTADGKYQGDRLDRAKFEGMKDRYYAVRGWDVRTGVPTAETLKEAGLKDVADELGARGKLPAHAGPGPARRR